jgi:hypothetical protein
VDDDEEYNYRFKVSGSPSTPLDFFKIPTDTNPEAGVSVKESGLKISLEVIKQASGESMGVLQMDENEYITFNFLTNSGGDDPRPITLSEFKRGEFNPENIVDINFFNIELVWNDATDVILLFGTNYFLLEGVRISDPNIVIEITFTGAAETADADGDGIGDNADNDDDGDGDGVPDADDAFPLDPTETADNDNDGVGDNTDAFPNDASETLDNDNDGVGNNADAFPNDPSETADYDGDGVGDNTDDKVDYITDDKEKNISGAGDAPEEEPEMKNEVILKK